MIPRIATFTKNYSYFLFGARGVGKTTLLKTTLPKEETFTINLLEYDNEVRFRNQPKTFGQTLSALPDHIRWIFIDEVQKIPELLGEVHKHLDENDNHYFVLTGSSARKLKQGRADMLAGRAFTYHLYPLTSIELQDSFSLDQALQYGTLPGIFAFDNPEEKIRFLQSYTQTYVNEEVLAEEALRNVQGFRRFFPLVGKENGNILSWANFASDVGIDAKTIRSYFTILEDTLIGYLLPAYHRSLRKKQRTHPKFYLFDTGVQRMLSGEIHLPLVPGTSAYGRSFEHFWIIELMRMSSYHQKDYTFSYFATHENEIDLVIERPGEPLLFIEIKAKEHIKPSDTYFLEKIVADVPKSKGICLCMEPYKRRQNNILICPWQEVLTELGF